MVCAHLIQCRPLRMFPGKASLSISRCLHDTCGCLPAREETAGLEGKNPSLSNSLRCLKKCYFKMTRMATCLYLRFLFRSASRGSSDCQIFHSGMCVPKVTPGTTQRIKNYILYITEDKSCTCSLWNIRDGCAAYLGLNSLPLEGPAPCLFDYI